MTTTMTKPAPFKTPPPTAPVQQSMPLRAAVRFGSIAKAVGHRVVIYGPGGIGKTTLMARLPGKSAMIDADESLPRLVGSLETAGLIDNIVPVEGIANWTQLRAVLQSDGWDGVNNVIVDSGTKAEEWAVDYVLANIKTEKGLSVTSVEGYGYGKGYQHVYETFLALLSDLDRHCRAGRNVFIVCHDCTATVPNPTGEDWLRYEPRLQSPSSGKASIRLRMKEWADHVIFLGYDVDVNKDGKARGSGTRTIYTSELPHCMAKSRTTQDQIPLVDGQDVWPLILK